MSVDILEEDRLSLTARIKVGLGLLVWYGVMGLMVWDGMIVWVWYGVVKILVWFGMLGCVCVCLGGLGRGSEK